MPDCDELIAALVAVIDLPHEEIVAYIERRAAEIEQEWAAQGNVIEAISESPPAINGTAPCAPME